MELEIKDYTTGIVYTVATVALNPEDYYRAREDVSFATKLLNGLIKEQNANDTGLETDYGDNSVETEIRRQSTETYNEDNSIEAETEIRPQSTNDSLFMSMNNDLESEPTTSTAVPLNLHIWQYNETVALINSMSSHYENLSHPKKKKYVFGNCANDLLSLGYTANATQCQVKWKSLLRSYSAAKDQKNKTGRGPSRFQFFEEIDIILGTKPSNKCEHAIESSTEITIEHSLNEEKQDKNVNRSIKVAEDTAKKSDEDQTPKKRKRMNYEEYAKERKYREAEKNRRHAERMEVEKQKLENDRKKIDLLKEYLAKK